VVEFDTLLERSASITEGNEVGSDDVRIDFGPRAFNHETGLLACF